jgi:nucleotide-binding universal stress UspA family protein
MGEVYFQATMKSLLAATDFSAGAADAARRAALIAASLGVREARLLHVVPALPLAAEFELRASRALERALDAQIEAVQRDTGFTLRPELASGAVVDEILRAARPGELIVVGARGVHPLRDFAIGTSAQRLLRKSSHPVLVVKRAPAGAYRTLLAPVDFSDDAAAALELGARLAPGAALNVVHAFEVDIEGKLRFAGAPEEQIHRHRRAARENARARLEALLASHRHARVVTPILEHGYAPSVIAAAEESTGADLMTVGKHGTSWLEDLLLGSVTEHVLAHAACDILVARAPHPGAKSRSP